MDAAGCGQGSEGVQPAPLLLPALLPRQPCLVPRRQGEQVYIIVRRSNVAEPVLI